MNFDEPWFIVKSNKVLAAADSEPLKSTLKSYKTQAAKTADAKQTGIAQAPLLRGAGDKTAQMLLTTFGPQPEQTMKFQKDLPVASC